jgi:hypothetical protein
MFGKASIPVNPPRGGAVVESFGGARFVEWGDEAGSTHRRRPEASAPKGRAEFLAGTGAPYTYVEIPQGELTREGV